MKRTELQSLINECIGEVLNEGRASKKKLAIQEIKRIIAENEIGEAELGEAFDLKNLFKSKPVTDEDIVKWLEGNPKGKKNMEVIAKEDPDRYKKYLEFVKKNFAKNIKDGTAIQTLEWDKEAREYKIATPPSKGK